MHALRNSVASVSLAIQSLARSDEVKTNAGKLRLEIASDELWAIRGLLDELEGRPGPRKP